MIDVNDKLPSAQFQTIHQGELVTVTTEELFAGKKVVLFAVPGAFTRTCSKAHLPGFVSLADEFKAKGVDSVICLSVNDAFVMNAWGVAQNADHLIMLADGGAEFTNNIGLTMETGNFGGIRSKRYAMIVEDGRVSHLNIEQPKEFKVSDAETMLALC